MTALASSFTPSAPRRRLAGLTALLCAASLLAGCQTTGGGPAPKTAGGALIGGLLAGGACLAAGGNNATCAALAATGAIIGGVIGAQMDERDREDRELAYLAAEREEAEWRAGPPPVKKTRKWKGSKTGNTGSITPLRAFSDGAQECREYTEDYVRNGEPVTQTTRRCRAADGTWQDRA